MILRNKKGGLSLLEILVALVVTAVLASIIVPTFSGVMDKGRSQKDESRQSLYSSAVTAFAYQGASEQSVNTYTGLTTADKDIMTNKAGKNRVPGYSVVFYDANIDTDGNGKIDGTEDKSAVLENGFKQVRNEVMVSLKVFAKESNFVTVDGQSYVNDAYEEGKAYIYNYMSGEVLLVDKGYLAQHFIGNEGVSNEDASNYWVFISKPIAFDGNNGTPLKTGSGDVTEKESESSFQSLFIKVIGCNYSEVVKGVYNEEDIKGVTVQVYESNGSKDRAMTRVTNEEGVVVLPNIQSGVEYCIGVSGMGIATFPEDIAYSNANYKNKYSAYINNSKIKISKTGVGTSATNPLKIVVLKGAAGTVYFDLNESGLTGVEEGRIVPIANTVEGVNWKLEGGTMDKPSKISMTFMYEAQLGQSTNGNLPSAVKRCYEFKGWSLTPNGAVINAEWFFGSNLGSTSGNVVPAGATLYAQWEADPDESHHTLTEITNVTATCTTTGKKVSKCDNCGKEFTHTVNALGHSYGGHCLNGVYQDDCYEGGWDIWNGKHYQKCSRCGDVINEDYHTYTWVSTSDSKHKGTCSVCGVVVEEDHSFGGKYMNGDYCGVWVLNGWNIWDGKHNQTCDKCGKERNYGLHSYSSVTTGVTTCTTSSTTAHKCVCGAYYTDSSSAIGSHLSSADSMALGNIAMQANSLYSGWGFSCGHLAKDVNFVINRCGRKIGSTCCTCATSTASGTSGGNTYWCLSCASSTTQKYFLTASDYNNGRKASNFTWDGSSKTSLSNIKNSYTGWTKYNPTIDTRLTCWRK